MSNSTLTVLLVLLVLLVLCSAFFSASETGMMSINRYRLRHMIRAKHPKALRVGKLLERTDRLLSVILIGNTFANIFASSVATILAVHYFGDIGIVIATLVLTFIILIFAEISPKTLASLYPQRIAFFMAYPLSVLLMVFYPIVFLGNFFSNGFLRLLGVDLKRHKIDHLSREELRTVVMESTGRISPQHQDMLLRVLDSEKITIDDVMIPRNEIVGINISEDWDLILKNISLVEHTRLPLYEDDIDNVKGILNLRKLLPMLAKSSIEKADLIALCEESYFIPEGTPLTTQILNFRKEGQRLALVVDEYGDIQGLLTVGDIIEEIIGEITTETPSISKLVQPQQDGSYLVDGSVNVRELNRLLDWHLPIKGPKTLSGIITEYLETIPEERTSVKLNNYPIEIIEAKDNLVKSAKVYPQLLEKKEGQ